MREYVKCGTVPFAFERDMADFGQTSAKHVTLMFGVGVPCRQEQRPRSRGASARRRAKKVGARRV
ncbi:MAG: hypothetical protein E6H84_04685 [Chloroflexi bacterium]|nr:MAG: hypothetical protein E6H84_04685 [Chloroflexota bacterium]TMG70411.1 MAG: hypothetical protein E6H81_07145 [Chloroflexota bacterium]